MEKINLFIVADNALIANGLKNYLSQKFRDINVTRFYDCRSCLKNINGKTCVVVLDHVIHGRSGEEAMRSIKTINPGTEVIMHTSRDEVASRLEVYCQERMRMLGQKAL
jgi:DNA-binding NtrC family response regulator